MVERFNKPVMVTEASLPPFEEYVAELRGIWDTKWLTNQGALHEKFREQLKEFMQTEQVTLCVNGHLALDIAIKALQLSGEVITVPFTFVSTTHAIVMNNLTPVFCDIKADDYTIDEDKIEGLITPRTSAILAVHVYGNPCNIEKLEEIAKRHSLKLIFDAAHVFGVKYKGRSIGDYGDVSMFSFHATKVFNTIEGGALVYKNPALEPALNNLKNFGIAGPEDIVAVGLNAKMNEFQAAMGICNLRQLPFEIDARRNIVSLYRERLALVPGVHLVPEKNGVVPNYAYFPIFIDEKIYGRTRNELFSYLAEFNIFCRKYFYPLVVDCECYVERYGRDDVPVARRTAERILTIPLFGALGLDAAQNICDLIADFAMPNRICSKMAAGL
jgi:dTDP-4-amino-4,6-dideoxygalactose transaminase